MADTLCISTARPGDGARVLRFFDRCHGRRALSARLAQGRVPHAGVSGRVHCALRLDVLGGNVPAERLYTGQGFTYRGTVRMFYDDTGWTDYGLYEYLL